MCDRRELQAPILLRVLPISAMNSLSLCNYVHMGLANHCFENYLATTNTCKALGKQTNTASFECCCGGIRRLFPMGFHNSCVCG